MSLLFFTVLHKLAYQEIKTTITPLSPFHDNSMYSLINTNFINSIKTNRSRVKNFIKYFLKKLPRQDSVIILFYLFLNKKKEPKSVKIIYSLLCSRMRYNNNQINFNQTRILPSLSQPVKKRKNNVRKKI